MKRWLASVIACSAVSLAGAGDSPIAPSGRQFFALSVPDAQASADWYGRAFGVTLLHEIRPADGAARILILGSDALLVEIMQLRDAKSPGAPVVDARHLTHGIVKIGLYVRDLDAAVAHLKKMQARFDTEIIEERKLGLRFVLVRDPDGNLVQLFSRLDGAG